MTVRTTFAGGVNPFGGARYAQAVAALKDTGPSLVKVIPKRKYKGLQVTPANALRVIAELGPVSLRDLVTAFGGPDRPVRQVLQELVQGEQLVRRECQGDTGSYSFFQYSLPGDAS